MRLALLILTSCSAQPPPDIQGDVEGVSAAAIAAVHTERHDPVLTTAAVGRDAITAAYARACGDSSAIELADIEAVSERVVLHMASHMTECVSDVSVYLRSVSSLDAVEDIGFAVGTIYPVALAVHASAGLTTAGLLDDYRAANETLIARLAPKCREWIRAAARVVEVHYECVAHNRSKAHGVEVYKEGRRVSAPLNRKAIDAQASRLTSRAVALVTLPKLEALTRQPGEQIL